MATISIDLPHEVRVNAQALNLNLTTEQVQGLLQLLIDLGNNLNAVFPSAQSVDQAALSGLAALKNDQFLLGFLVSLLNKV